MRGESKTQSKLLFEDSLPKCPQLLGLGMTEYVRMEFLPSAWHIPNYWGHYCPLPRGHIHRAGVRSWTLEMNLDILMWKVRLP